MTWQGFINKGSKQAMRLSGDPKIKMFINGMEVNLESLNFELVKDKSKDYDDYQLVISN